ncbi:MAG: dihydropyrimidinase [Bacteriovoracaceae bacterium]|nr:dihydropyrimidinase [Bacteriovoracaceae bacterium]
MGTLLVKNGTIVTENELFNGDIFIDGETISIIDKEIKVSADRTIDALGNYIFPGGIDAHTHMELPVMGTHSSDDFITGTTAALHGGTTTIIDFANQVRGDDLHSTLQKWHDKAGNRSLCDYGFHISVTDVNEDTISELKNLVEKEGVTSFKTFLAYDAMKLDLGSLERLMIEVKGLGGIITTHTENGKMIDALISKHIQEGKLSTKYHPLTRPNTAESDAAYTLMKLAEKTGCPTYMVHMTSTGAANYLKRAKEKGLNVFGETCPQYLFLDEKMYAHQDFDIASQYIMSPPVRALSDRDGMWKGIKEGTIQVLATDHCPFMLEQKRAGIDDFTKIPNGAPGVEDRLELLYSEGVDQGIIGLQTFVKVTATNPAKLFGLYPKKGVIAVGSDADLVIFDPNEVHQIKCESRNMRVDYNLYEDRIIKGKVKTVLLRGKVAIENNECLLTPGFGNYLKRGLPDFSIS